MATSPLTWSNNVHDTDDFEREQYGYDAFHGIRTRVVWITNYTTNENFLINVPADDPVTRLASASESKATLSDQKEGLSLLNKIQGVDLATLNLDDLLLLLHRLQHKTVQSPVVTSTSTMSSSSGSAECTPSFRVSCRAPPLCKTVHSSFSLANRIPFSSSAIRRRKSSFALPNIADVPKQLTTTLARPISSFHSHNGQHAHSPNDVVNKLLQSFNTHNSLHHRKLVYHRHPPSCTYQESQQHKAQLLSNLFSSHPIGRVAHRNTSFY